MAQNFVVENDILYSVSRGKTQTVGRLLYQNNTDGIIGVEVEAYGQLDSEIELQIGEWLAEKFNLQGGVFSVDFNYDDSGRSLEIMTDVESYETTLSPKQQELLKKPPLWRAGRHQINSVGWSLAGTSVGIGVVLIGQPLVGGAICIISAVVSLVETLKSARALQEASDDSSELAIEKELGS